MPRLSKRAEEFQSRPSAEELVVLADRALGNIETQLEAEKYSLRACIVTRNILSQIAEDLDIFVETGGGLNAQKAFWPINKRMSDITYLITSKILEDKSIDQWYDFLKYRVENLIEAWNIENVKKSLEAGKTDMSLNVSGIKSSVAMVKNEIETYEKKFGSTFDPSLVAKLDAHINELEAEFKLFLGEDKVSTQPALKIETVDSDRLLDLYQELEKMPLDDPARLDKIHEFEKLQRILKSSKETGMKKSRRTFSREFRKESLRNMDQLQLERPVVKDVRMPVFNPEHTGEAEKFNTPSFSPEKKDLFKHKDPNEVISDYDLLSSIEGMPHNKKDLRIIRLKYLQQAHNMLLGKMFEELGQKLAHKEISDRFWDTLPADIRGRYRDKIASIRKNIREIYRQFPQHFEQYKKQNKPYFRKHETQ
jgi:hypothetical protein